MASRSYLRARGMTWSLKRCSTSQSSSVGRISCQNRSTSSSSFAWSAGCMVFLVLGESGCSRQCIRAGGSVLLQERHHLLLRRAAGDVDGAASVDEDIDLAADAELRQVDPRLDGEAGARQDAALLVSFQVVHVGAVAVRLLADRVPGAVAEVLAVAGLLDHVAGGSVHLPALEGLLAGVGGAYPVDGGIAGPGDDAEHPVILLGHFFS